VLIGGVPTPAPRRAGCGWRGKGLTVGVRDDAGLRSAVTPARQHCPDVLVEEMVAGEDLRVVVDDVEVSPPRAPARHGRR
jgi:D-alanine-D-alanine ligase-like ATP-grasp enzyme